MHLADVDRVESISPADFKENYYDPTFHGIDIEARFKLADEQNRVVVIVGHDPRLRPFSHRTVLMRDGSLVEHTDKP